MAVRITCVNKDEGNHQNPHEGITTLGWTNESTNVTGRSTRDEMVNFIEKHGAMSAYVKDRITGRIAYVAVVSPPGRRKFLRTHADGYYNDNLLSLGEC